MGNVNETPCETGSTTIHKAIKASEGKKEDDKKNQLGSRPKKRNRHSEPTLATIAKSEISVVSAGESCPSSRLRIRDVDNSEMWISMNSPKRNSPARMHTDVSTTSSNISLPISESGIPGTFDISAGMSFVNRSEISDFFVAPSLADLGVVDQVSFAEIPSLTTAMAQIELEEFTPEASSKFSSLIAPTCSHKSSALDPQLMTINSQTPNLITTPRTPLVPEIIVRDESIFSYPSENAYMAISPSTSSTTSINVDVACATSIFAALATPSSHNIAKHNPVDFMDTSDDGAKTAEAQSSIREPAFSISVRPEISRNIANEKIPKNIPPLATYADATNLAVQFPEIASQVLSLPLLSLPSKSLDESSHVRSYKDEVSRLPHTAANPNWAVAPLEPDDILNTGTSNSRSRRRQSGRSRSPSRDERSRRQSGRGRNGTSRAQPNISTGLGYEKCGIQHNVLPGQSDPSSVRAHIPRLDATARSFVPRLSYNHQESRHSIESSRSLSGHQREPRSMSRKTHSASATCQVPAKTERTHPKHIPKIPKTTIATATDSLQDVVKSQATVLHNVLPATPPTHQVKAPKTVHQIDITRARDQEVDARVRTGITDPCISKSASDEPPRPPINGKGKQNLQSTMASDQVHYMVCETQASSVATSTPEKSERAVTFGSTIVIPVFTEGDRSSVRLAQVSNAVTTTHGNSGDGFHFIHDPWVSTPAQDSPQAVIPMCLDKKTSSPPRRSRSRSPASEPPGKRARRSKNQASLQTTNPRVRPERQKVRKQQVAGISAAARRHLGGSLEQKVTSKSSPRRHSLHNEVASDPMNQSDGTKQKQLQNYHGVSRAELPGPVIDAVSEKSPKSVQPGGPSVTARAPGSGDSPFRDIHLRAVNASPVLHQSPGATKGTLADQCDTSANSIQHSPYMGSPLAARDNDAKFQAVEDIRNASFELGLTSPNNWLPPHPTQSIPESVLSSVIEPTMPTMPYATPFSTLFKTRTKSRSISLQAPKSPISWRRTEPLTTPTPFGLDPDDNSTPSWLVPPSFFTPDPTSGKYIVKGRLSAEGLEKYPGLPPARSRKSLPSQASMNIRPSSSQGGGSPFKFGTVKNDPQSAMHDPICTTQRSMGRSVSMKIQKSRA